MAPIGRLTVMAFDCREPRAVAEFYAAITGWPVGRDLGDWIELDSGGGVTLGFQLAPEHEPPEWPSSEHPQQAHCDFEVEDLDEGEARVLAIGARKAAAQPDAAWRVFLDPAGHPFCLVLPD